MFPSEQWEVMVPTAGVGMGGVQTLTLAASLEGRGKAGQGPELGIHVDFLPRARWLAFTGLHPGLRAVHRAYHLPGD